MADIEGKQLVWYGNVQKMKDIRLLKLAMDWVPLDRRKRVRLLFIIYYQWSYL